MRRTMPTMGPACRDPRQGDGVDFAPVENLQSASNPYPAASAIPNSASVDACGKRAPGLHLKVILNTGAMRLNDIREGPPT